MASLDPGALGVALTGGSIYVSMLPKISDVRRASTDSATGRDVRVGVTVASVALVGTGVIIGALERDGRPIVLTLALAAMMAAIYEVTLRTAGEPDGPGIAPARPTGRWA